MLRSILLAARPKTLPAAIVPVWTGCVLSWKLFGRCDVLLASWTLLGAVAIQIATNFFNDAIDSRKGADTAARLGPQRVTAAGLMSTGSVMAWGAAFVAVAFACGVPLYHARGWPIIAMGIPSLLLTYGYTGGPFPLAYRGMGELFVILFFGIVAVTGTVFIQTGTWPLEALLLGLQIGCLSAVLISVNNLRDREEDLGTGKRTLAVRLGAHVGKGIIAGEIGLAVLLGISWAFRGLPLAALAGLPLIPISAAILKGIFAQSAGAGGGGHLNRLLALGGLQLIVFSAAYHWLMVGM